MAISTLIATGAASGILPREIHAGVNAVCSVYSLTATLTVGDIIQICKLPDGARVLEVIVANDGDVFDGKMNIGTRADHDKFMASLTFQATTVRANRGLGTTLDVSDAATTRHTMIEAKISDSTSASGSNAGSLHFCVLYSMDQASD